MPKEYEFTEKIMGTELSISIVCTDKKIAGTASMHIIKELQKYENMFSRFNPNSELSKLNKNQTLKVSGEFIEAISEAKILFNETQGFFNPLLQIHTHGYDSSFEILDKSRDRNLKSEIYNIDFESVRIDSENKIVKLSFGQQLDFGGFLKGYLAEKMARTYFNYSKDITGIIINIGGDIYTMGLDENLKVFEFSIFNPMTNEDALSIPLFNSGLATSGTYKRKWRNNGKDFNHILDASGQNNPVTEILSVTIINQKGSRADSYTKLFLSKTPEDAMKIIGDASKYILINKEGEVLTNIKNENIL